MLLGALTLAPTLARAEALLGILISYLGAYRDALATLATALDTIDGLLAKDRFFDGRKAASEAIVRSLALELAPRIQVNTLRPSIMSTVSLRAFSLGEKFLELAATESPLGPARLTDLVSAALFLCSSDADYITGQTLDVDGGMSSSIFRREWVGNGTTPHEEARNVV